MAFEGLSDKLSAAFKRLRNKGKLNEADVKEAMREVRLALLEADVNYKVAKDFTNSVTQRAIGSQVLESLTPAQMVIKIVNEELTALMGGRGRPGWATGQPAALHRHDVRLTGLRQDHPFRQAGPDAQKAGAPAAAGGLRRLPCPAAITQLQVVGEKAGVRCLRWARQTRWTSPKRRWLTPGITATTM